MFIGIFLVIVGLVWLLSNTGIIPGTVANYIWPAILIAVGLSLLFRERKKGTWTNFGNNQNQE